MAQHIPKVFISATSGDLRTVRQAVRDALLNIGCMPVVQEHFPPDYRDVSGMLRAKIAECDALIHIAGLRYGAEPDPASLPEGTPRRSYTQMEVDLARELKLEKVFTFVCPEDFPYDTTDASGDPLAAEPEELRALQVAHRERLLRQKELRYSSNSPEELAAQVREIQLQLQAVKGELSGTRKKMFKVGAAIAVALAVVAGVVLVTLHETGKVRQGQQTLTEQLEIQQQAPRVLSAYQERFREIRDDPNRDTTLPNALIDKMVRAELPDTVGLEAAAVTKILEIEAPRLAADRATPINLKLAALFAMGEYDATLEQGKDLLVEPTIEGLRTMGDAALAKFEQEPDRKLREEAIRYYRGSQALIDRSAQPEEWAKASMLLADALRETGAYGEADPLYREALETRDRVLGRDHPDTLVSINSLALLLYAKGDYAAAEPLYRETLETSERVLGPEHPDTLFLINNLAVLLKSKGDYAAAEPLHREALESSERVLGREHPETLTLINNLAGLLEAKGDYAAAEPLYREALESGERVLGREHPETLTLISNLAGLLHKKGGYVAAEQLVREALESSERVLGHEHPRTLKLVNNLAVLLHDKGDYAAAEPLDREVLEMRERVLGREHPDTLVSINNLALLLYAKGDYAAAEPLYREALEILERVRGREHPQTLSAINNLAVLLLGKGDYAAAEPLYREALETRERVLGREHIKTLASMNNLANLLYTKGDYAAAEPLLREALEISERVLGREHPKTRFLINNLARLLEDKG